MADRRRATRAAPRTATSSASSSPRTHRFGVPQARVVETLGNPQDQRKISLIAVHAHGIPDEFPARRAGRGAEARAAAARRPHRPARSRPPHHRSRRRARPRRCRARRTRRRSQERRRLHRARRHRRRRPLRAARHPPRPRGAASAATRSTSPTASCRCCPSASPTTCARCREQEERPCLAARMVFDKHGNKRATPSCAP